ncbi:MAG: DCC1-like thiol-disulfide oxidoreductase family protein [Actinomycetota bacterium]
MSRVVLFYDGECRACRTFTNLVLKADTRRRIRTAPLDSPEADRLLGHLPERRRFGSFHLAVGDRVVSGGAAVGPLLELLPPLRPAGKLIRRSPVARRAAHALYHALARNRGRIGRLLPRAGDPSR